MNTTLASAVAQRDAATTAAHAMLADADLFLAYALMDAARARFGRLIAPALTVTTDVDGLAHVTCPHCATVQLGAGTVSGDPALYERDVDDRHNGAYIENVGHVDVSQAAAEYQTLTFVCAACDLPVSLPEGHTVSWS